MVTKEEYNNLDDAYKYFNTSLFNNNLPDCLITYQRKKGAHGYFWAHKIQNKHNNEKISEIALNIDSNDRYDIEVLSTLVHEMCHLWQCYFGKMSRGGYHNKQWFSKMIEIGLEPTGKGQKVSHDIVEGQFKTQADKFIANGFKFDWQSINDAKANKKAKKKNKVKYSCPACGLNVWAKPDVRIACVDCDLQMDESLKQNCIVRYKTNNQWRCEMVKLSNYYRANKRQLIKNWKDEYIKGKHNYSMLKYIQFHIQHIMESDIDIDMSIDFIELDLYRSL